MDKKLVATITVASILLLSLFSGCIQQNNISNKKPIISIRYPSNNSVVHSIVMISGLAYDPDGEEDLTAVEIKINDEEWHTADGTTQWSFEWNAYDYEDGTYTITARAWDGKEYSDTETITLIVDNPDIVESSSHKWAIFIAASNFPNDNESKLGNGGLYLAEEMAEYLIENCRYSTSNIFILFDDGWIRNNNGYGKRVKTLQERSHKYNIIYGGATKKNVIHTINYVIKESNKYRDSEIFLWIFNHGYGDKDNILTGGKILEHSIIFTWDDTLSDKELGELLGPLKSKKTCIIIDACYSGGFADKTILNLPTPLLLRSKIPQSGRIVITGASKFRKGYTSTTEGPLFSQLWFKGLKTGEADGFKPGILNIGRPTRLRIFKDGKVSVEEAFYYARYMLRTDENIKQYKSMQPQINDNYPQKGFLRSLGEMILGED